MPYFFFMKHPMCLSVRREGKGRREKGPELACAATSSLQAEPLPSWGNARTAPRSSAWPFPTVQPGCSHGSCWVPTAPDHLSCLSKRHLRGVDPGRWPGWPGWGQLLPLDSALWLFLSQQQPRLGNTGYSQSCDHPWRSSTLRKAQSEAQGPAARPRSHPSTEGCGAWQEAHFKERSNV